MADTSLRHLVCIQLVGIQLFFNNLVEFYFWCTREMAYNLFEAPSSTHSLTIWLIFAITDIQSDVIFGPFTNRMNNSLHTSVLELNLVINNLVTFQLVNIHLVFYQLVIYKLVIS